MESKRCHVKCRSCLLLTRVPAISLIVDHIKHM